MAFDILIAGGGNAAEQCFYLIACPIAFVLVILQGVNERFLQRNQKAKGMKRFARVLLPLISALHCVRAIDPHGFHGILPLPLLGFVMANIFGMSAYMAANASVQMLKTLYAAARQPVPAVFQRTPKLTIYFFVAVNLITALRFGLPQDWLEGVMYLSLSVNPLYSLPIMLYTFSKLQRTIETAIEMSTKQRLGDAETLQRSLRRVKFLRYFAFPVFGTSIPGTIVAAGIQKCIRQQHEIDASSFATWDWYVLGLFWTALEFTFMYVGWTAFAFPRSCRQCCRICWQGVPDDNDNTDTGTVRVVVQAQSPRPAPPAVHVALSVANTESAPTATNLNARAN